MNSEEKILRTSWSLGLALIVAFSVNLIAQTPRDEIQTPPASGRIAGRVVTENSQPLPNATVYLRGSVPFFQPLVTGTNSEGNFQFSGVDPALYGVFATAPAYVLPPRDPDEPTTYYRVGDSVTLSLVKGGVITGTVLSPSGEPVVQVLVQALLVRNTTGQSPRYAAYQSSRSTDDRGIYRIYGLLPGTYVVSAGGSSSFNSFANAYSTDAPTYSPSSTRDTASEIMVRAGEETTGVDIRYRGDPGHVVSGHVSGPDPIPSQININLIQISKAVAQASAYAFQPATSKGFAFYGVGDGVYDLHAQSSLGLGEITASEPRRITVKGADVTGIELTVQPLGSIGGHVALEMPDTLKCKNKRQPLFSETLVMARRSENGIAKDQARPLNFFPAQGSPNKAGDFGLRNLAPGRYSLNARYFPKYWYLRSITRDGPSAQPTAARVGPVSRQTDVALNGINLKFGERITGVTLTLTRGAASLRGTIKLPAGENVPPNLYLHLVPDEKENTEDVLRFFAVEVNSDGTFALNNLPPGRYWALVKVAADNESHLDSKLRAPDEKETRAQVRRAAEAAKSEINFKPCQNLIDYQIPFANASLKN